MKVKHTTLCAVVDGKNEKVLMIKKMRGMKGFSESADGMAKDLYNLPGGKVLSGESFHDCALRETAEETGVTPLGLKFCGLLRFEFPDLTIINQVFKTAKWSGEISHATDECRAEWVDLDKIPYDNMWADDPTWFPEMLEGKLFHYKVVVNDPASVVVSPLPIEELKGI